MSLVEIGDYEVNGIFGYLIALPIILMTFLWLIIMFIVAIVLLLLPFAMVGGLIWLIVWLI